MFRSLCSDQCFALWSDLLRCDHWRHHPSPTCPSCGAANWAVRCTALGCHPQDSHRQPIAERPWTSTLLPSHCQGGVQTAGRRGKPFARHKQHQPHYVHACGETAESLWLAQKARSLWTTYPQMGQASLPSLDWGEARSHSHSEALGSVVQGDVLLEPGRSHRKPLGRSKVHHPQVLGLLVPEQVGWLDVEVQQP